MNMWSYWKEKFRECLDFECLSDTVHECYEECDKKKCIDDVNDCYSICNQFYEENVRMFE